MWYPLTRAVNATGVSESTILRAIEAGRITGTRDLFGEWQVEHTELDRVLPDAATLEAEIGALIKQAGDSLRQPLEAAYRNPAAAGGHQAQALQLTRTAPEWDHDIRIHDRDKFWIGASLPGVPRTRIALLAGALAATLCMGWIGGLNTYRFFGGTPFSAPVEQKLGPSAAIPKSGNQIICAAATEARRDRIAGATNTGKIAAPKANGFGRRQQSPQSATELHTASTTRSSPGTAQNRPSSETATAAVQPQAKLSPRPVATPETRPTTIEGWTVRNVVDGTAILEGPDGVWKAARGDTVPGVGRVDSIVLWGSRWIVATTRGLITTQ